MSLTKRTGVWAALILLGLAACGGGSQVAPGTSNPALAASHRTTGLPFAGPAKKNRPGQRHANVVVPCVQFDQGPAGCEFQIQWTVPEGSASATYSASGLPAGWTSSFSPNPAGVNGASLQTVQSPNTATAGAYSETVTINYSDGTVTNLPFTITISPCFDCAVMALGPYAYYKLNEGSGTVAADSSGNNRNGTFNGTAGTDYILGEAGIIPSETWTSTKTAGIVMNNSAPVTMGQQLGLAYNGTSWVSDMSIVGWIKPATLPQAAPAAEWNGYGIGLISETGNEKGDYPAVNVPCSYNLRSATSTFSDGNAHFIAGTVHGTGTATTVTLYVDGVYANQINLAYCNESTFNPNTAIGADSGTDHGHYPFNGYVEGVVIFSQALTASEVMSLYKGNIPT
jgi:Concanavalin A-like lectin/glucanases superfamily